MAHVSSRTSLCRAAVRPALVAFALLVAGRRAAAADENTAAYAGPIVAGRTTEPRNQEASGLAASRRAPGLLWTHSDSGGEPVLFALQTNGTLRGRVRLRGVINRDWEDLAAFVLDGRAWLLIADVGDNASRHERSLLLVVPEPDPATLSPTHELNVSPAYRIAFVYPDGPRDCESVAVAPAERAVYLLSKRDRPARLYRLPLAPPRPDETVCAEFVGLVPHLPRPSLRDLLVPTSASAFAGQPTAMDFLSDESAALVLTYDALWYFSRQSGESWATALARAPVRLADFSLPQAEGACFTSDGSAAYVVSENSHHLLRYDRTVTRHLPPADPSARVSSP